MNSCRWVSTLQGAYNLAPLKLFRTILYLVMYGFLALVMYGFHECSCFKNGLVSRWAPDWDRWCREARTSQAAIRQIVQKFQTKDTRDFIYFINMKYIYIYKCTRYISYIRDAGLEFLLSVVRKASASQHSGAQLMDPPLVQYCLWCSRGYRRPLIAHPWCREVPASRTVTREGYRIIRPRTIRPQIWFFFLNTNVTNLY